MQSVTVCHEKDIHSRKLTGCRRMLKPCLGEPRCLLIALALAWLKLRCSFAALISNRPWRWLCAVFTNEEHLTFFSPFFLPQKHNILENFPGLSVKLRRQMVSVGTVASQCLAELDPPSTNFNGGSTCGQIYREAFLFTKC